MANTVLSNENFIQIVQPLLGLTISLPWKGYGTAIFLELGVLAPPEPHRRYNVGEACIYVAWDWRVEAENAVLYGSSNSRPKIEAGILSLRGTAIQAISIVGPIPELVVQFSNGHCLRSMIMVTGDPEWFIRLQDGRFVTTMGGDLLIGNGSESSSRPVTEEEAAVIALTERIADRWGAPSVEPKRGSCAHCIFFIRLDGEGSLLSYGCCATETGPFDGRVVERSSGCPAFTGYEET